jgi:hypothetical protein
MLQVEEMIEESNTHGLVKPFPFLTPWTLVITAMQLMTPDPL